MGFLLIITDCNYYICKKKKGIYLANAALTFYQTVLVQGVPNSILCMGISKTVRDTKSVKLRQSCAIGGKIICCLKLANIPNTFGDIREKPKFCDFVFIFSDLI